MTINPIGISNPNQAIDPTSFQTRMQQTLAPVAQLFGESSDQLMSELDSGSTSLSVLASQKGISQTDLINTIKQGLQQSATSNGQTPSDSQLTNMAARIAGHKHGGHHHHGGGGAAAIGGTTSSTDPTATSTSATTTTDSPTTSATEQLLQLLESQGQTQNAFNQTF